MIDHKHNLKSFIGFKTFFFIGFSVLLRLKKV